MKGVGFLHHKRNATIVLNLTRLEETKQKYIKRILGVGWRQIDS